MEEVVVGVLSISRRTSIVKMAHRERGEENGPFVSVKIVL